MIFKNGDIVIHKLTKEKFIVIDVNSITYEKTEVIIKSRSKNYNEIFFNDFELTKKYGKHHKK